MKTYMLILIFPFVINCSPLSTIKTNKDISESVPTMQHFNKVDINKDNVIDKDESIKFYNKNNSINYSAPLYIFLALSGGVLFICFWPLVVSYLSSLIKKIKKTS